MRAVLWAALFGHLDILQLLINAGATASCTNKVMYNCTSFDFAEMLMNIDEYWWTFKIICYNVDEHLKSFVTTASFPWHIWQYMIWAATWQNQQSACAPSEDSDQPGHPPSLIWVFAVRMKKSWVRSYPLRAQRRLWSDCAVTQADLCLRWAHSHFVSFVMSRLISILVFWLV